MDTLAPELDQFPLVRWGCIKARKTMKGGIATSKEIDPVQIVYVKIKLKISRHVDVGEVIAECDYKFDHEDIWDTEIVEVL